MCHRQMATNGARAAVSHAAPMPCVALKKKKRSDVASEHTRPEDMLVSSGGVTRRPVAEEGSCGRRRAHPQSAAALVPLCACTRGDARACMAQAVAAALADTPWPWRFAPAQFVAPQGMRIAPGQALLFCPIGGGMSDSIYTGSSADDHAGGSDAGVAFGRDPSGGEMAYQFGNLWVSSSCDRSHALPPPPIICAPPRLLARPLSPPRSNAFCSAVCVLCALSHAT